MGATNASDQAFGKDAQEAYEAACREANLLNGHQEGYSGDIQTTDGYRLFVIPKGVTFDKFMKLVIAIDNAEMDDKPVRKSVRNHIAYSVALSYQRQSNRKWDKAACVQVTGKPFREAKAAAGLKGTRKNLYHFDFTAAE